MTGFSPRLSSFCVKADYFRVGRHPAIIRYGEGLFLIRYGSDGAENTILKTPNNIGVEFRLGETYVT
jgi:hypothetical protein